jgi:hypothetical protein
MISGFLLSLALTLFVLAIMYWAASIMLTHVRPKPPQIVITVVRILFVLAATWCAAAFLAAISPTVVSFPKILW